MREVPIGKLVAIAAAALVAIAVAIVVRGSGEAPEAVSPIAWHREPCAHCKMLIGEPAYAAQIAANSGEVLSFDDPGCALRYLDEHPAEVSRVWFHHSAKERWLSAEETGFLLGGTTPMGYGLRAVERATAGALDLAAARAQLHAARAKEVSP